MKACAASSGVVWPIFIISGWSLEIRLGIAKAAVPVMQGGRAPLRAWHSRRSGTARKKYSKTATHGAMRHFPVKLFSHARAASLSSGVSDAYA
jgi:hypothetical protein